MKTRALSPVIAAILMIIVVVSLVIILYGFATGLIGGTTTTVTEVQSGITGSTATGRIDNIDTANEVIYVRSTNTVGADIDSIYIDGVKTACNDITLAAGGIIELNADSGVCSGLTIAPNQTVVVAGTNNFQVTYKS